MYVVTKKRNANLDALADSDLQFNIKKSLSKKMLQKFVA